MQLKKLLNKLILGGRQMLKKLRKILVRIVPPDEIQCPVPTCDKTFRLDETEFYCQNPDHPNEPDPIRAAYINRTGGAVGGGVIQASPYFKTARPKDGFPPATRCSCGVKSGQRICPHCHSDVPLHHFLPSDPIALVGGPKTGKSHFLTVLADQVQKYAGHFNRNRSHSDGRLAYTLFDQQFTGDLTYETNYRDRVFQENRPIDKTALDKGGTLVFRFNLGNIVNTMLILHDVAGEHYSTKADIMRNTPWIADAKGLILLLEPNQFTGLQRYIPTPNDVIEAGQFINLVHQAICELKGIPNTEVDIPVAVCINKLDLLTDGSDDHISDITKNIPKHLRLDPRKIPGEGHLDAFHMRIQKEISEKMSEACERWGCNLAGLLDGLFSNWEIFGIQVTGCESEEYLFEIDSRFQTDLESSGTDVSATLRTELINKGISTLSGNLEKEEGDRGKSWKIADNDSGVTYTVKKDAGELKVYENKFVKPITPDRIEDPLLWLVSGMEMIPRIST